MMILRVEESDLRGLLFEHKESLQPKGLWAGFTDFLAGVFYVVTVVTVDMSLVWQIILAALGLLFAFSGLWQIVSSRLRSYTVEQLFEDIRAMDRTEVKSTLIAIKAGSGPCKGRYLLYHDDGWDCDFFPNHKTLEPATAEKEQLARYLGDSYGLELSSSDIFFVTEADSEKPSKEHENELRYYHYRLYSAVLENMPLEYQNSAFTIESGKLCSWKTIDEMLADERTYAVNHDVLRLVRDYAA